MSSQSKEFSKNISIEYFAEKVSSDEKYVSLLYDFMSDNSDEFSKNITIDKFQSKLGFTETVSPTENKFMNWREDITNQALEEQNQRRENILKLSESETTTDQNVQITEMYKLSPGELIEKETEMKKKTAPVDKVYDGYINPVIKNSAKDLDISEDQVQKVLELSKDGFSWMGEREGGTHLVDGKLTVPIIPSDEFKKIFGKDLKHSDINSIESKVRALTKTYDKAVVDYDKAKEEEKVTTYDFIPEEDKEIEETPITDYLNNIIKKGNESESIIDNFLSGTAEFLTKKREGAVAPLSKMFDISLNDIKEHRDLTNKIYSSYKNEEAEDLPTLEELETRLTKSAKESNFETAHNLSNEEIKELAKKRLEKLKESQQNKISTGFSKGYKDFMDEDMPSVFMQKILNPKTQEEWDKLKEVSGLSNDELVKYLNQNDAINIKRDKSISNNESMDYRLKVIKDFEDLNIGSSLNFINYRGILENIDLSSDDAVKDILSTKGVKENLFTEDLFYNKSEERAFRELKPFLNSFDISVYASAGGEGGSTGGDAYTRYAKDIKLRFSNAITLVANGKKLILYTNQKTDAAAQKEADKLYNFIKENGKIKPYMSLRDLDKANMSNFAKNKINGGWLEYNAKKTEAEIQEAKSIQDNLEKQTNKFEENVNNKISDFKKQNDDLLSNGTIDKPEYINRVNEFSSKLEKETESFQSFFKRQSEIVDQFSSESNVISSQLADTQLGILEMEGEMGTFLSTTADAFIQGGEAIINGAALTTISLGGLLTGKSDAAVKLAKSKYRKGISDKFEDYWGTGAMDTQYARELEQTFWGGAWLGLVKSAPAICLSMLTGGAGSAVGIGTGVTRTIGLGSFSMQQVDYLFKELDSHPELKNISEAEKWAIIGPTALVSGFLEEFGLNRIARGNGGIINTLALRTFKNAPTKTITEFTKEGLKKRVYKEFEDMLAKGLVRVVDGVLTEGWTGASQEFTESGIKELYEYFKEESLASEPVYNDQGEIVDYKKPNLFKTAWDEGITEVLADVIYAGGQEAVGGFLMSTPSAIYQGYQDRNLGRISTDDQYRTIEVLMSSKDAIAAFKADIEKKFLNKEEGFETREKTDAVLRSLDQASGIIRQIPKTANIADRKRAYDLITEKQVIEELIHTKQQGNATAAQKEKISEIQKELDEISLYAEENKVTPSRLRGLSEEMNGNENESSLSFEEALYLESVLVRFSPEPIKNDQGEIVHYTEYFDLNSINNVKEELIYIESKLRNDGKTLAADDVASMIKAVNNASSTHTVMFNFDINSKVKDKSGATLQDLATEQGESYYVVNGEITSPRKFEKLLNDKEFREGLATGKNSYAVVNASQSMVDKISESGIEQEVEASPQVQKVKKNIEAAKVVYEAFSNKTLVEDENYKIANNKNEYKSILKKITIDGRPLTEKEIEDAIESDAFIKPTGSTMELDGKEMEVVIDKEQSERLAQGSFSHEVLHKILDDLGFNEKSIEEKEKILKDFLGRLDNKTRKLIEQRMEKYGGSLNESGDLILTKETKDKDGNISLEAAFDLDELLTAFSDLIVGKKVEYKENVFTKVKDWFKGIFGGAPKNINEIADIKTGKQAFEFIKNYGKQVVAKSEEVVIDKEKIKQKTAVEKKTTTEPTTEKTTTPTGELGMYDADISVQKEGGEDVSSVIEEKEVVPEKITRTKIKKGFPDGKGGILKTTGKTGNYKLIRTDQDGNKEILGTFNTLDGSIARANEYIGLKPIKKTTKEKVVKVKGQNDIEKSLKGDIKFANKVVKELDRLESIKASDGNMLWYNIFAGEKVTLEGIGTFSKADLTVDAIKRIKEYAVEKGWMKTLKPGDNIRKSISKPVDPSIKISDLRFSRSTSKDRRVEYKKQNRNNKVISKYNEDIVYEIIKEYESLVGIPKLDQIIEGNIQKLKGELYNNNIGRITIEAKKAYDKGFAVDPTTRITIEEFMSGFSVEFNELIRTYLNKVLDGQHRNVPFGAYIADNLPRRYGQILNALKKQFEGAELTGATEIASEKRDLAAIEEDVAVDKIEKSLRKELGLNDEFRNRVLDKVKAIFKGKLPHPSSPEFKAKLEKEFETALFDVIREDLFGAKFNEKKNRYMYDWGLIQERLDQYAEIIYDKLPIQTLVSLNRNTWKKGELIMKPVIDPKTGEQKWMSVDESDRSKELFGYEVKDREAGNLVWTKQNSSEIKEDFINFFLNPIVSRKAMRMEGLFKVLAKEIAFDATMETVNNPEVYERMQDLYELQGINLLGNELEIIAKEIDRSPGLRFSKNGLRFSFSSLENKNLFLSKIDEFTKAFIKNEGLMIPSWNETFGEEFEPLIRDKVELAIEIQEKIMKSNLVKEDKSLGFDRTIVDVLESIDPNKENPLWDILGIRKHKDGKKVAQEDIKASIIEEGHIKTREFFSEEKEVQKEIDPKTGKKVTKKTNYQWEKPTQSKLEKEKDNLLELEDVYGDEDWSKEADLYVEQMITDKEVKDEIIFQRQVANKYHKPLLTSGFLPPFMMNLGLTRVSSSRMDAGDSLGFLRYWLGYEGNIRGRIFKKLQRDIVEKSETIESKWEELDNKELKEAWRAVEEHYKHIVDSETGEILKEGSLEITNRNVLNKGSEYDFTLIKSVERIKNELKNKNLTPSEKAKIIKKHLDEKAVKTNKALRDLDFALSLTLKNYLHSKGKKGDKSFNEALKYLYHQKWFRDVFGDSAMATNKYWYLGKEKITKEEHLKSVAENSAKRLVNISEGRFDRESFDGEVSGYSKIFGNKEHFDVIDLMSGVNSRLGRARFLYNLPLAKKIFNIETGKSLYEEILADKSLGFKKGEIERLAEQQEKLGELNLNKPFMRAIRDIVKSGRESRDISNEDILSLAATMDAALDLARNPDTPVKKIRVFDFDDTLAKTKSKVLYTMPDGTKGKLTAEEFAKKGEKLLAKGAVLDFSEFNKIIDGKKGPLFEIAERIQKARGTEDVFVLTARSQEAAPAIKEFLNSIGLNIPLKNITGLGNGSPFAKSQWVIEKAAEGYNDFYFADDHAKNVQAVQDALDQLTDVKARTQIAIITPEFTVEEIEMDRAIDSPTEEGSDGLLNIRFSKNSRELYTKQLTKRRKDLTPQQIRKNIDQVFRFVDKLDIPQNKKKKFEKLTLHYLANGYLILPEDGYKVTAAEKIARLKKLDPFSFKNPNEIMALAKEKIEDDSFDADQVEAFSNKKEHKDGLVVYDVENSKEGQLATRAAIDANWGRKANPWCLAARDSQAPQTREEAWEQRGIHWSDNIEYETQQEYRDAREELKDLGATVKDASYTFSWDDSRVHSLYVEYDRSLPHPDHGVMFDEIEVDDKGVPVHDELAAAYTLWKQYGPNKKIAFLNGKLIAFRDGKSTPRWWNRMDKPSDGIPTRRKLKDGFTEVGVLQENGDIEVDYLIKGNEKNGRLIKKKPDGTIVEDITREDGKPVDGWDFSEMSEGNTMTRRYKNGQLQETINDYTSEFTSITRNKPKIETFDQGKKIKIHYTKREDTITYSDGHVEVMEITEGKDVDGNKIVYREKKSKDTGRHLLPRVVWKEFNGEKYMTEYDIKVNELVEKHKMVNHQDQRGRWATYRELMVEKGEIPIRLKRKRIPVDEQGNSLRFSMNTRMDLTWKKKSTELDFLNYTMDTHTTTFVLDNNEYEIKMVKMLQEEVAGNLGQVTAPEGDYYDVSFAHIDENGVPHIDITGKAGKKSGSVISIITNGVLDFVRSNKIDGITYSSKEVNRTKLYNTLTNLFASELGWGKRVNEVTFDPMALDPELTDLYSDLAIGQQNDFTEFTVSKHLPVKKDLTNQKKPVRDVMRTVDKGSTTQTNNIRYSKSNLNKTFNHIIESKTGIAAEKTFDEIAKGIGKKKGRYKFFVPYSAEDFVGLMYPLLSKGKLGNKQMEWFNEVLFKPFARAMENVSKDRNQIMRDFRELKKNLKNVPKNLRKEALPGLTYENAVRIYLWDKQGFAIPGLNEDTMSKVWELMQEQPELQAFADQLLAINKGDGFAKPDQTWMAGTITTDLLRGLNTTKRKKYLEQWQKNVDIMFSPENMLKLEATYGKKYVEALRDSLRRMKTGVNKKTSGSRLENLWLDWVNNSVGVVMFLNTRSALLQTISAINFVNWSDNNPIKAGAAFANQPQYWKDFMMLMNSEFLVDRRSGLRINVSESEIADAASTSTNKVKGVVNLILKKGFVMTQFADSFAIASGGATFYRNRVNTYIKQGLEQKDAEQKAFQDFRELAEESQQSSRPDRISQQQASGIGRLILAFANTPMQYTRLIKKAVTDLRHGRGDWKTNMSRIVYYGFIQNVIFNTLQQALFALAFDDEEEEEIKKKYSKVGNGMLDSLLRGMGYAGAAISVGKNFLVEMYDRSKKDRPEYQDAAWKLLDISPPIDHKITKIRAALGALDYEMDEIKEQGFSLDQPAYLAAAQVISAFTNVPIDRLIKKAENVEAAINEDYETWQKVALLLGYSDWQIMTTEQKTKQGEEREAQKALKDPSRYNKNQQVDVLKQFKLTDSEIEKLNTEEKRVDKIQELEKQEGKQYKPRVDKEKRLSTEEKYKNATKGLTKKEVQVFDKLEEIYALSKTEQVAILMKKEGLTKKWVNGKYKTEVDRVKRIYEIEHSKNDNAYKKWSEYRKREEKPKQDKEKVDADALYEEIF
jgi:hypothetical protein